MVVKRNLKTEAIELVKYLLIIVGTLVGLGLLGVGLSELNSVMNPIECRTEPVIGGKICKNGDGDWVPQ